jgi:hypothetical protein
VLPIHLPRPVLQAVSRPVLRPQQEHVRRLPEILILLRVQAVPTTTAATIRFRVQAVADPLPVIAEVILLRVQVIQAAAAVPIVAAAEALPGVPEVVVADLPADVLPVVVEDDFLKNNKNEKATYIFISPIVAFYGNGTV